MVTQEKFNQNSLCRDHLKDNNEREREKEIEREGDRERENKNEGAGTMSIQFTKYIQQCELTPFCYREKCLNQFWFYFSSLKCDLLTIQRSKSLQINC